MQAINVIRRWLANKIAPSGELVGVGAACSVCDGRGEVYATEGWYAPGWIECQHCVGTGENPVVLSCGCLSVRGTITSASLGHGHVTGGPKYLDKQVTIR